MIAAGTGLIVDESLSGVDTMRWKRIMLALPVLMTLSMSSVGQDSQAPEEEAAPEPPPAPETRPLDEIFIPSEEIAADEEITFPVNI
jgi:hypothetical protein